MQDFHGFQGFWVWGFAGIFGIFRGLGFLAFGGFQGFGDFSGFFSRVFGTSEVLRIFSFQGFWGLGIFRVSKVFRGLVIFRIFGIWGGKEVSKGKGEVGDIQGKSPRLRNVPEPRSSGLPLLCLENSHPGNALQCWIHPRIPDRIFQLLLPAWICLDSLLGFDGL